MGNQDTKDPVVRLHESAGELPEVVVSLDTGEFNISIEEAISLYSLCSDHQLTGDKKYEYADADRLESVFTLGKVDLESNNSVCSYCSGKIIHEPRFELYNVQTFIGKFHDACLSEFSEDFESLFAKHSELVISRSI